MSEIFLSYSREDTEKVRTIAAELARCGGTVCWDQDIPMGKTFENVIQEELDSAKCVIVLWSKHSVNSHWVRMEAAEGLRRRIRFPILIDNVNIPLGFRNIQTARLID